MVAEAPFYTQPQEAAALQFATDTSNRQENSVGVIIDGTITSAFTETPAALLESAEGSTSAVASRPHRTATDDGRVIIIGDTDFIGVLAEYTQSFYNYTFFQDAVTWLVNDADLLSIRTRSNRDVRLNALEPEQRSVVASFATFFNVTVMPIIVIVVGVLIFLHRRRNERMASEITQAQNKTKEK